MFFTKNDYKKIEEYLLHRSIKDSEFPVADIFNGSEDITIIQDSENKKCKVTSFVKELDKIIPSNVYNLCTINDVFTLEEAVLTIPVEKRKEGLIITFRSKPDGDVLIYQYTGVGIDNTNWNNLDYWYSPMGGDANIFADEEDLTIENKNNKKYFKIKDREYDSSNFSGKATKILRKNLVTSDGSTMNVLTQSMINNPNTIYIIRYDFTATSPITIPNNCVLDFQGGSINGSSVDLNNAALWGVDLDLYNMGSSLFTNYPNGTLKWSNKTGKLSYYRDDKLVTIWDSNLDIEGFMDHVMSNIEPTVAENQQSINALKNKADNPVVLFAGTINRSKVDLLNNIKAQYTLGSYIKNNAVTCTLNTNGTLSFSNNVIIYSTHTDIASTTYTSTTGIPQARSTINSNKTAANINIGVYSLDDAMKTPDASEWSLYVTVIGYINQ